MLNNNAPFEITATFKVKGQKQTNDDKLLAR